MGKGNTKGTDAMDSSRAKKFFEDHKDDFEVEVDVFSRGGGSVVVDVKVFVVDEDGEREEVAQFERVSSWVC